MTFHAITIHLVTGQGHGDRNADPILGQVSVPMASAVNPKAHFQNRSGSLVKWRK